MICLFFFHLEEKDFSTSSGGLFSNIFTKPAQLLLGKLHFGALILETVLVPVQSCSDDKQSLMILQQEKQRRTLLTDHFPLLL